MNIHSSEFNPETWISVDSVTYLLYRYYSNYTFTIVFTVVFMGWEELNRPTFELPDCIQLRKR